MAQGQQKIKVPAEPERKKLVRQTASPKLRSARQTITKVKVPPMAFHKDDYSAQREEITKGKVEKLTMGQRKQFKLEKRCLKQLNERDKKGENIWLVRKKYY